MKKIITLSILMIGFTVSNIVAQVTPMHRAEKSVASAQKIEEESKERSAERASAAGLVKEFIQIELKTIVVKGKLKVEMPKIDLSATKFSNKDNYEKIEKLSKISEMASKEGFQLVFELSKLGYKVVSHSFQLIPALETEVHYYILEL